MPNKNYLKGRRLEYLCLAEIREEGYFGTRTPASKSCIDVIGIDLNFIRLIQVKSGVGRKSGPSLFYDKNIRKLTDMLVPVNCRKELWVWKGRRGWDKRPLGEIGE